jgi:protein-disulfide isomerase
MDGASGDVASDITAGLANEQALSPIGAGEDDITEQETTSDITAIDEETSEADSTDQDSDVTTNERTASVDVEAALSERGIGNPDAPVVIKEFASLTCGHCGDFHRDVYKELKETYIDTGEVYLIMVDFPLNGPAVHGSMVARCLPEARYAGFMQLLFENQDKWAYDANYLNYLRQNAALAGLGSEAFDACINNEELRNGIMEARAQAQQTYSINSTPSFVVNEGEAFSGTRNFAYFKEIIDTELAETQE